MDEVLFPDGGTDPETMSREQLLAHLRRLDGLALEYRRSEEALRLDEARLEALLKLNDMVVLSENDIISYSLEEAIRLTGSTIGWMGALSPDEKTLAMHCWSRGTKERCNIADRPHALRVDEASIWMEPILRGKPIILNDYANHRKKCTPYGHIPIDRFLGIPVYDGPRIVAVAEVANKGSDYDHSDLRQLSLLMSGVWRVILRKRAEEALSEAKAQAELYVDFMGHDINNMNQVAMGFLELAMDKLVSGGGLERGDMALLEKPLETMRNSAKLIDNVKKLQRLRAGVLEPRLLDIGQVLSEVKNEAVCPKDRRIRIDYRPVSGRYVRANELLKDVFSNLVANSIKHSCPDKPLWLSIALGDAENGHRITIEDDGPGIPEARKGQIFDRLSQGKMKALRTGLGLGLVKTLVENYGGRIWMEDRIEGDHTQGSRFVVILPAAAPGSGDRADTARALR